MEVKEILQLMKAVSENGLTGFELEQGETKIVMKMEKNLGAAESRAQQTSVDPQLLAAQAAISGAGAGLAAQAAISGANAGLAAQAAISNANAGLAAQAAISNANAGLAAQAAISNANAGIAVMAGPGLAGMANAAGISGAAALGSGAAGQLAVQQGAAVGGQSALLGDVASDQVVTCPLVGTFYAAPSPDAEDYVKVGDRVKKGQVLGLVEAMKLMNEIESEFDGIVDAILVKDGEVVEYGQPLFRIR